MDGVSGVVDGVSGVVDGVSGGVDGVAQRHCRFGVCEAGHLLGVGGAERNGGCGKRPLPRAPRRSARCRRAPRRAGPAAAASRSGPRGERAPRQRFLRGLRRSLRLLSADVQGQHFAQGPSNCRGMGAFEGPLPCRGFARKKGTLAVRWLGAKKRDPCPRCSQRGQSEGRGQVHLREEWKGRKGPLARGVEGQERSTCERSGRAGKVHLREEWRLGREDRWMGKEAQMEMG